MSSMLWLCAVLCIVGWVWVFCYPSWAIMYFVPLPIPKELLRLFVEHLWVSDPPVRLHLHRKHNTGICTNLHMRLLDSNPRSQSIVWMFFLFITATTQQQPVTVYQVPPYSTQVINTQTYVQPPYPGFIYSPGKYQVILVWQSSMSRLA